MAIFFACLWINSYSHHLPYRCEVTTYLVLWSPRSCMGEPGVDRRGDSQGCRLARAHLSGLAIVTVDSETPDERESWKLKILQGKRTTCQKMYQSYHQFSGLLSLNGSMLIWQEKLIRDWSGGRSCGTIFVSVLNQMTLWWIQSCHFFCAWNVHYLFSLFAGYP